jgi:hypothetical protein
MGQWDCFLNGITWNNNIHDNNSKYIESTAHIAGMLSSYVLAVVCTKALWGFHLHFLEGKPANCIAQESNCEMEKAT